jgi:hypothetical protein
MHKYILYLFAMSAIANPMPQVDFSDDQKIAIQNSILAKVDGNTISVIDVKKKMDLAFHKNYPHLEHSTQARYQFYEGSWRHVLMEMIDHQLILTEAAEKQIPLSDGEVREEMEYRFGPNIMLTLDKIGLTYDETWKMVKDELLVQRMTWWFIHSKAMSQVTPQDIRQAFRIYLKENPAYEEWKYQVIAIRGKTPEDTAKAVHNLLTEKNLTPELARSFIQEIDPSIQLSAEFSASDKELSEAHRAVLSQLNPGTYSAPVLQKSKVDNQIVARIFFLSEKINHPAPQFDTLAGSLRNELVQKAVSQESTTYLEKLRKNYPFYQNIPNDFHPFSLQ